MKNLIVIAIITICSLIGSSAQTQTNSLADVAWENISEKTLRLGREDIDEKDNVKLEARQEKYARMYFSEYLDFWKKFPQDPRAIQWITTGIIWSNIPNFWKNIEEGARAKAEGIDGFYTADLNWDLLEIFDNERSKIKKMIMNDVSISGEIKQKFKQNELEIEMHRNNNSAYRRSKKKFLNRVKYAMENAYSHLKYGDKYSAIYRQTERIFFARDRYGLNTDDLIKFTKYFKDSSHLEIRQWAMQKLSVFALEKEPFELKHHTIDGKEIDVAKLRGKVVLIDFWSNTCTVCIRRMPTIKRIYDKYKDNDFIVISVARNPNIDRDKILKIHERIGADWPLLLIGGDSNKPGYIAADSIADKIWKKYGFNYVPQLLLLDKEGKLAMYNGILMNGDFEPLVKKLLAK